MNRLWHWCAVLTIGWAMATVGGCSSSKETAKHGHDDHDHEALGPHGGHLIELGDEEFHGELTHDDPTHKVIVYLLDGAAKAMPPATELPAEVKLSFNDKGKDVEFTLARVADGKYELVNEPLCTVLGGDYEVKAKLMATIAGKPYVGTIEHSPHEGHHHHHHDHAGEKKDEKK